MSLIQSIHSKVVFKNRVKVLANHLAQLLPEGAEVLDVGCGDGTIDSIIKTLRPDLSIKGIDTFVRKTTLITVSQFDGIKMPFKDNSFDVVLFVDVLHHAQDPIALLAEAKRVTRNFIIIKDHINHGFRASITLRFMDWVGNKPHGVALPYNYFSLAQWHTSFKNIGMYSDFWKGRLNLYPWPASFVFDSNLHFITRLA